MLGNILVPICNLLIHLVNASSLMPKYEDASELVKAVNQPTITNIILGKKLIEKSDAARLIGNMDDYLDSLTEGVRVAFQMNSESQISKAVMVLQKAPRKWRTEQKYKDLRKLLTPQVI